MMTCVTQSRGLDDVIFGKVSISSFCGDLSNFSAENRFFILSQFVEVTALQKNFQILIVYLIK